MTPRPVIITNTRITAQCGCGVIAPVTNLRKLAMELVHRFEMESMALHKVQREWLVQEITASLLTRAAPPSLELGNLIERLRDHALFNKQERCKLFEEAADALLLASSSSGCFGEIEGGLELLLAAVEAGDQQDEIRFRILEIRRDVLRLAASAQAQPVDRAAIIEECAKAAEGTGAAMFSEAEVSAVDALRSDIASSIRALSQTGEQQKTDETEGLCDWPVGCLHPNSCARHGACMYVGCKHHGEKIAVASAMGEQK